LGCGCSKTVGQQMCEQFVRTSRLLEHLDPVDEDVSRQRSWLVLSQRPQ
jgi:hypothetical protein